jgi:hypothetical protein
VAEVIFLDVHADDLVVDLLVLGEADGLAAQALDMSAEVEVSALNLPGALLADPVQVLLRQQPGVGVPLGGVADLHLQRAETLGLYPVDEEGVNLGQAFF